MKVVVDTSVWSLALRRNRTPEETPKILRLRELIADHRVALLGVIRQEVLSGIRAVEQFVRLREYLRAFPNLELTIEDYELAAEFYNTCRRNGIQGSNTDFYPQEICRCWVTLREASYVASTQPTARAIVLNLPPSLTIKNSV
ncbi:PIN domain nuclease [Floridanema evergladense]|uniref:PIN domain nuclease n=1 Tax=Floridaenema evergladense BLCC-F167 TaxID=3153639 RepID=A0ABV4WVY8_9CYAN